MKTILLTTTALVAFAGAASAESHGTDGISFGGSAALEYNDIAGFTSEAGLSVTMSRALDNGLTASASVSVDLEDNGDVALTATDYVLSLSSDSSSLTFGDTDPVAAAAWSGVDGSSFDGFDENSAYDDVLASSVTFGATTLTMSNGVDLDNDTMNETQVGVATTLGGASIALAYQSDDEDGLDGDAAAEFTAGELLGVSAAMTVAGADVKLAYLTDMDDNSFGVDVSYPVGAVTVGGYYSVNSATDDAWGVRADYDNGNGVTAGVEYLSDETWTVSGGYAAGAVDVSGSIEGGNGADAVFALDASYDMGNGVVVIAGLDDNGDTNYAGASYALGDGASAYVRYATAAEVDPAEDFAEGTTVGVSFTF